MSTATARPGLPAERGELNPLLPYRVPSLLHRTVVGAVRLVVLVGVLVVLPVEALSYVASRGLAVPVSVTTIAVFGLAICVASTARYIARPTRAYGPIWMVTAGIEIAFLLTLLAQSTYHLGVPGTAAVLSVTYARLVEILLVVPILWFLAGLTTTIEDLRSPGERLPFDYPA